MVYKLIKLEFVDLSVAQFQYLSLLRSGLKMQNIIADLNLQIKKLHQEKAKDATKITALTDGNNTLRSEVLVLRDEVKQFKARQPEIVLFLKMFDPMMRYVTPS